MRALALLSAAALPILALAACGETAPEQNETKAEKARSLEPGQYEVTSEVTAFRVTEEGDAQIKAEQGARATETICVEPGEQVAARLFAGEGYDCDYTNYWLRNGRINSTLNCRRAGLSGNVAMSIEGTFEADSFDVTRRLTSFLHGPGDVEITSRLTGRRTGDCPAEGAQ